MSTITRTTPVTTTFVLPAQTTPFSYPYNGDPNQNPCKPSVYCPVAYNQEPYLDAFPCILAFTLDANHLDKKDMCYPPSYFTLFSESYHGQHSQVADITTAAYPGTACPADWTTAYILSHTDTSSFESSTLVNRQAMCCQPGFTFTSYSDKTDSRSLPPERHCVSYLSTATEIWVSWDPPAHDTWYTWKLNVTATTNPASVYHYPLPLALPPIVVVVVTENVAAATATATATDTDAQAGLVNGDITRATFEPGAISLAEERTEIEELLDDSKVKDRDINDRGILKGKHFKT
ncbi:uncharacterized protein BCR38DRAFT_406461 [Pseudomassariella vexata]|uniref:Uncharacterized protein n=1 Tax=Pseudomassariella vexata TaxID=1141098 RepID=A0A1Y2EAD0_9PEZI|nr:uncharacterized protein BCR38DRAFT_406461 [Pseudomassariella vexata]ORY68540.1 hypothetical protein BCR38DRAFT_406461 [Pseudomassariella vexata]